MSKLVEAWQSIPEEARGAIWMWLASAFWGALREVLQRVPAGSLRGWVEALDLIAHYATASSRALKDRVAPEPKRKSFPPR